jgi:hypothetical protein
MTLSRRAFLLLTGAMWTPPGSSGARAATRTWVIDEDLPQSRVFVHRLNATGARIASLSGDAGWLWIESLSMETEIGGLTRFADAFVLAQFGADIGLHAKHHRAWKEGAVLWTLAHG